MARRWLAVGGGVAVAVTVVVPIGPAAAVAVAPVAVAVGANVAIAIVAGVTDLTYDIPKGFAVARHLGNAWRMIRGDKSRDVELLFDKEFAETVADTHWHKTQEVIWRDDGSMSVRCTVDGLDEIVWWVLSMGPHYVVKRPAELARRVQELAGGVVARYEKTSGKSATKAEKAALVTQPAGHKRHGGQ